MIMKNKNKPVTAKNLWMLLCSLGICSGVILIDRFVISVPNNIAIICDVVSVVLLLGFLTTKNQFKKNNEKRK